MRMSILVGLILVLLGGATLYQTRNGFFMYLAGHLTYWPPNDPATIVEEFDRLAEEDSETLGLTLGDIAATRLTCLKELTALEASPDVSSALRRFNLVLLGVGVNSNSPIIAPNARRITELRPDLTRDSRPWREPAMNEIEKEKLEAAFDELTDQENPIYAEIGRTEPFWHLDFSRFAEFMLADGKPLHACVVERK